MSDTWNCPHCGHKHEKTPQLKMAEQAKKAGSVMIGLGSQGFFCDSCGKPVDGTALMKGDYDTPAAKPCFVATAVYGGADAPEVARFRQWRDEHLRRTAPGRTFSRFYERVGPVLARVVLRYPASRRLLRPVLDRMAVWLRLRPSFECGEVGFDETDSSSNSYQTLSKTSDS